MPVVNPSPTSPFPFLFYQKSTVLKMLMISVSHKSGLVLPFPISTKIQLFQKCSHNCVLPSPSISFPFLTNSNRFKNAHVFGLS